jgi:DNA-binding CsgD family transcriptional regulator
MSCGILLINESAQVLWVNDIAQRMLRNGLFLSRGRIEAVDTECSAALNHAFKQTFDPKPRTKRNRSFLIPRGGTHQPYVMHTYLMAQAEGALKGSETAIVIMIEPNQDQGIPAHTLAGYLKLPPGEARVAAEIARGLTPRNAAKNLGLTEDSVRVILKRVYSKVNVSRQSQLVLLVSQFGNCTPNE